MTSSLRSLSGSVIETDCKTLFCRTNDGDLQDEEDNLSHKHKTLMLDTLSRLRRKNEMRLDFILNLMSEDVIGKTL